MTDLLISSVLLCEEHGVNHDHNYTEILIANNGNSQIHTFFGDRNTELVLGFSAITKFSHGHHARSGGGRDSIHFKNLDQVKNLIVGRLEDLDYTRDKIVIEGVQIDLKNLPQNVRIVSFNGAHNDPGADPQQWISIKTQSGEIFYALEGARVDMNVNGGSNNGDQESHFITTPLDTSKLRTVAFIDPVNVVPSGVRPQGGVIINDEDIIKSDVLAIIRGTASGDLIAAGLNDDRVQAGAGNDRVWGGSGNDRIWGENGDDIVHGNTGKDTVVGGAGNDRLYGDSGEDILFGGSGSDVVVGGHGNDKIFGGDGNDQLLGGAGNDAINGDGGDDTIYGYGGSDLIFGSMGNDFVKGGPESDRIFGGDGSDRLTGQEGSDLVFGGNGHDLLCGEFGKDFLRGEAGNDFIFGGADGDRLYGGTGNDILKGGNGSDLIVGNQGADHLFGGYGADRFMFLAVSDSGIGVQNRDVVRDFQRGLDKIDLSWIDADRTAIGNQSFDFIGGRSFDWADSPGVVSVRSFSGGVCVYVDVDGSGGNDMEILVNNVNLLSVNDFIF